AKQLGARQADLQKQDAFYKEQVARLEERHPTEEDKDRLPFSDHISWQVHAAPSETCLPDREQRSNSAFKCDKNDTFMLLLNNNRFLRRMQCPI
ncbi:unnamed protein product, partial [Tetraodon nigroviridis]